MPEPTTTAVATIAASTAAVQALTVFGVPLGIQADFLIAGFGGSLVGIILLNTVPGDGDTLIALTRTTLRRMFVACASATTAAYITPLAALAANVPDKLMVASAFAVGCGAQQVLVSVIKRFSKDADLPKDGEQK